MKKIYYTIGIVAILLAVTAGFRVYALVGPTGSAPSQSEIATPINNSSESQIKNAALISKEGFGAGTPWVQTSTGYQVPGILGDMIRSDIFFPENSGQALPVTMQEHKNHILSPKSVIIMAPTIVSPWGFFTRVFSSSLIIGGTNTVSDLPSVIVPLQDNPYSVKIDLVGRGAGNNSIAGTQAISIYANMCSTYTTIRVPSPEISFIGSSGNYFDPVDMLARQVRLTGGNPKPNSVLTGTTWSTVQVVNGQIQLIPNQ